jgi:hypothetical protein
MSEVRCAGGHFMGHQKETPPYSFTTTAKLEYIGKEGDYLVYRSSRPHPMREGPVRRNNTNMTPMFPIFHKFYYRQNRHLLATSQWDGLVGNYPANRPK